MEIKIVSRDHTHHYERENKSIAFEWRGKQYYADAMYNSCGVGSGEETVEIMIFEGDGTRCYDDLWCWRGFKSDFTFEKIEEEILKFVDYQKSMDADGAFNANNITCHEFHMVIMWFANHASRENFCKVWGEVMGNHFWNKWASAETPDEGTMRLFYGMSDNYVEDLFQYLEDIKYKG